MLARNALTKFHDYNVEPSSTSRTSSSHYHDNDDVIALTSSLPTISASQSIDDVCNFDYDDIESGFRKSTECDLSGLLGDNCEICLQPIASHYVHVISGRRYHEKCLKCSICGKPFGSSCFVKEEKFYCKEDYIRIWKTCRVCDRRIEIGETYLTLSSSHLCHEACLECKECQMKFHQGDKCHITSHESLTFLCPKCWDATHKTASAYSLASSEETCMPTSTVPHNDETTTQRRHSNDVIIATMDVNMTNTSPRSHSSLASSKSEDVTAISEDDERDNVTSGLYLNNDTDGDRDDVTAKDEGDVDDKRVKRPRTILSASQRHRFNTVFKSSQKPTRKAREALASETGLSVRVVQVWFQNQRAKMKKLAKRHQGREHTMTSRDRYGYHGYDHVMSQPTFPNEPAIADLRFNSYPHHQQDLAPWEGAQGIHQDLYPGTCYMEHTLPMEQSIFQENQLTTPNFGDPSIRFPVIDNAIGQPISTNSIPQIVETPINPPITNDEMHPAIDGLYNFQNQYYNIS